jgi:hypothetical protein
MQAVRLVFFLSDDDTIEQDWTNNYHKVVDVQGDTEVEMMLPYSAKQVMMSGSGPIVHTLWVKVLNYSSPSPTVNAPIYLNVYKAGAEDMQFGNLLERCVFRLESNPRVDFAKKFSPLHEKMTGYGHEGIVNGENYTSLREVIHKYFPIRSMGANGAGLVYNSAGEVGTGTTQKVHIGLEAFMTIFKFHRGSIRFKLLSNNTKFGAVYLRELAKDSWCQCIAFTSAQNPVAEFEVPFWSNVAFKRTDIDQNNLQFWSKGTYLSFILKAGGDDFSGHFLMPPDSWPSMNVPVNLGMNGLGTWLTQI